ncbi:tyrosine-type recombinase/integrase [Kocuria sp. KD4]|uniref:tyrosine-type recombinase/integrase n=1 Tax=Kocuria TaxID=57493 RepID=UPI00351BAACB
MQQSQMAVEMRSWMPASERTGYVLASETGGLLEPQNMGTAWRQVRVPGFEHVQLHHLRSTVATVLAADDLRAASAQLGHSSTRITEAHYVDRLQRPYSRARMKIWVRPAFGGHTTGTHSGDIA